MSPEQLQDIRFRARLAQRDASDATTSAQAASRSLTRFREENVIAREEMWRRVDRHRRTRWSL
jgi:hypothetical protein